MRKELICIVCPKGCHLSVLMDEANNVTEVSGNTCIRGANYGKAEVTSPKRMLTTTVKIKYASHPLLPIVSNRALPKDKLNECMDIIRCCTVETPIHCDQVIIGNIANTGTDMVASCDAKRIQNDRDK